ncbi:MAG: hypothetical protein GY940_14150, partial [bacterium]|nr:hypothetical protein [bacterium]
SESFLDGHPTGPSLHRADLTTPYAPPGNKLQGMLVKIWETFTGIQPVGIHDDFFEIGGDSLKAITMVHKIHKELDTEVPLAEFFNHPTIDQLSAYMEDAGGGGFFAISPVEEKEYYPLSSGQKRLYFLNRLDGGSLAYNEYQLLRVEGELDRQRFEDAFDALINRQESLRISIATVDNEPVQIIHDRVDFQMEFHHSDEEKADIFIKNFIDRFVRPFDLEHAPLLRAALVQTGENRYFLVLDMHHIITDGFSHDIFTRDFLALYNHETLPGLSIRYRDFTQWQNRLLQSDAVKEQEGYWMERFSHPIPVLDMPLDFPRPKKKRFRGNLETATLDRELAQKVYSLAKETDTTLYMVFLALYTLLLSKYTLQEDIVVGSTISGRTHADLQDLVGMFVNMVAMRNRPRGSLTFDQFLAEVKENALAAYANQDYHVDLLVKKLKVPRETGRNPLFDVAFAFLNIKGREEMKAGKLNISSHDLRREITKFELALRAVETDDTVIMELEYSTEVYKQTTARTFLDRYLDVLEQAVNNRHIKTGDIALSHRLLTVNSRELEAQQGEFEF